ncbi:hypothetical protein [Lignipirellula cremea]|uniref:Uncharacterized protein n=1 Tax=Lignipirellula cremea TaxID=2528010 RepID=A0A518E4V7_9BACT|nr:hypothetical protein [Lignipirellula cremea]QDU99130.1 hypothetical protein Pla8534_70410 [Lignipirellula cremea]
MNQPPFQVLDLPDGGRVWLSQTGIAALSGDTFYAKQENIQHGVKIAQAIQQGKPLKSAFGMLTKSIELPSIRSVTDVPNLGMLSVRGGPLKDPIRLDSLAPQVREDIFQRLYRACGATQQVTVAKANPNDVPFSPIASAWILLGLLGVGSVVMGAYTSWSEGVDGMNAPGLLGRLIGPTAALAFGVLCSLGAAAGVYFWWIGLPQKRTYRTQ